MSSPRVWSAIFCVIACSVSASGAGDESSLIAQLESAQSAVAQKDAACQALRVVGTARSVPVLAQLLTDETLSQSARLALEPMPCPQAGDALRDALTKTTGRTKAGIIDSLGRRHDRQAVWALAGSLADADRDVAASATAALGNIDGPESLAALRGARLDDPLVSDALLKRAERCAAEGDASTAAALYQDLARRPNLPEHLRVAAWRGIALTSTDSGMRAVVDALAGQDRAALLAAVQLVREVPGADATRAFAGELSRVPADVQVLLLGALAQRGDRAAAPAVAALLRSTEAPVRVAAASALAWCGDASAALALAETAAITENDADREAVRQALAMVVDPTTGQALLAALPTAAPPLRREIVTALGRRHERAAAPALLQLLAGVEAGDELRLAALRALAMVADTRAVDGLLQVLQRASADPQRDAAAAALMAACGPAGRADSAAVDKVLRALRGDGGPWAPEARAALLRVAAHAGGETARAALRAASSDTDASIRDAAVRAVAELAGPEAMEDLLRLAADAGREPAHRVIAMRGYWRLVALCRDRTGAQRLALCRDGLTAAQRPEEKRLGLAELAKVHDLEALRLAEALAEGTDVAAEAQSACLAISLALLPQHPTEATVALRQLAATAKGAAVREQARTVLAEVEAVAGYVTTWSVAGPYRQAGKGCRELFDIAFDPERAGAVVGWQPLAMPAGGKAPWLADLLPVAGGDNCVVYARCRVWSPAAQPVRLLIGSDDGIKLWINGSLVHSNNAMRPLKPGQDRVEAQLREGWNDVLAKVTQNNQGCGVCLQFRQADGGAVEGLRIER